MNPLMIVALALMAAGTYTQYRATSRAQKAQQAAILEAQRRQTELSREAGQQTTDFAGENYDPETRAVSEDEASQKAEGGLLQQAVAARDRGVGDNQYGGEITEDYSTDRARTMAKTLDRAATLANLIGKTRGATDLRFNEGIKGARLGGNMADLASLGRSRAATDSGLIQIAGQVDPGMIALGQLMSSAGTTIGMSSLGSGTASSGGTVPTSGAAASPSVATAPASGGGWFYPNTNPWANYTPSPKGFF